MTREGRSEVEDRYSRTRRKLDDGGYMESFGLDSLRLVDHLYGDLEKTTESFQKTLLEYSHFKKVAEELECGVSPFKEENIRLHKENSQLRIGLTKALEEAEDRARDPSLRLRDSEAENNDLKLLVSQFAERIKRLEVQLLEKSKRIIKLQEKEINPSIVVKGDTKRKLLLSRHQNPSMEVDGFVAEVCPQCIRLRNYVEYGRNKERNPKAFDYMKLADSRIEALQLQLRSLKNLEKEHLGLITSLKSRVDSRDSEIDKLRELIKVRPGRDNKVNGAFALLMCKGDNVDNSMELKSAEMQLTVLQRRNMELEEKLKKSILQEHQDFMLRKTSSFYGEGNVARLFLEKELDKYPSHDQMTLLEKLYYLERQLSHCCKEKAVLKRQIEDCKVRPAKPECVSQSTIKMTTAGKPQQRQMHGMRRITSNKQPYGLRTGKATKVTDHKGISQKASSQSKIRSSVVAISSDDESIGDNQIMPDNASVSNSSLSEVSETDDVENYEIIEDEGSDKTNIQVKEVVVSSGMVSTNPNNSSKDSAPTPFGGQRSTVVAKHQTFSSATKSSGFDSRRYNKKVTMDSGYDGTRKSNDSNYVQIAKPPTALQTAIKQKPMFPVPSECFNSDDEVNANQETRFFDDNANFKSKMARVKLKKDVGQIAPGKTSDHVSQKTSKVHEGGHMISVPVKNDTDSFKTSDEKHVKNIGKTHRSNMQKKLSKPGNNAVVHNKVPSKSSDNSRQIKNPKYVRPTIPNRKELECVEKLKHEDLMEDEHDVEEVGGVEPTGHSENVHDRNLIRKPTGVQTLEKKTTNITSTEGRNKTTEIFRQIKPNGTNTFKPKGTEKVQPEAIKGISGFTRGNTYKLDLKAFAFEGEDELDDSVAGYYDYDDDDDDDDENKSFNQNEELSENNVSVRGSFKEIVNSKESIVTNPLSVTLKDKSCRGEEPVAAGISCDSKPIRVSSSHGPVKSDHAAKKELTCDDGSRRGGVNSNVVFTGKASSIKNDGTMDSTPHVSSFERKDVDRAKRGSERKKGISAIKEPSLLSISEYEKDQSDDFSGLETSKRPEVPAEDGVVLTRQSNPYNQHQAGSISNLAHRDNSSLTREFKQELTRNISAEGPDNNQSLLQHGVQSRKVADPGSLYTEQQHFQDPRRGFTEREYIRGVDDHVVSFGDSMSSYTRKHDENTGFPRYMQRGKPEKKGSGQFDDAYYKPDYKNLSNPYTEKFPEERQSVRSVGINTEDHHRLPFAEGREREDSLERKALMDKIITLQSKLDDVHAECSQHQLKSFEVQGELERTKHMLQVEKQERDLAVSELKRVRELNSESTARMLMNSALGSDGSFRRGTTPMEMEREIINLRTALASLDRDKDEMRVELDRKDERIARLTNEASKFLEELSQLKLRLKNAELQINHTGESAKEQTREVEFLKKQLESNRRDLEKTVRERDEALKDLHKLSGAHSKGQMERRSIESELEVKHKEADDLRRQVQRYIDEVRRIEELLLDKEEEMETLIQHYKSLSLENNNLEAQRTSLEREASSIRDSVRESVEQNISFKTQLVSQNALVQSLEQEIQNLTQQISQLETQVASKSEKEKMMEADANASKDLIYRLEVQMDKLKLDVADSDSKRKQLQAESTELTAHISSLEARLSDETERQHQLENLVANSRDKDFQMERTNLGISRERDELTEKLICLQQRSETLNSEVSRYRLKSIELQNELDRTRRQLDNEKRERETAISELRRVREQLSSSSANYLLNTALATSGSTGANLSDSSIRNVTPTSTAGSTFRQNLLNTDIQRTGSREQSPFAVSQDLLSSRLQLDPPVASSTSRNDEQHASSIGTRNNTGTKQSADDEFEEWDSPTK